MIMKKRYLLYVMPPFASLFVGWYMWLFFISRWFGTYEEICEKEQKIDEGFPVYVVAMAVVAATWYLIPQHSGFFVLNIYTQMLSTAFHVAYETMAHAYQTGHM